MNLRVGDKIRLNNRFPSPYRRGEIYEVCEISKDSDFESDFICRVKEIGKSLPWSCLIFEAEIELLPRVGQQLMLFEI